MQTNDLVSIIIPCHNHGQFLEETVVSATEQTYPNIEIIIINDGSTDNTEEIALSLQEKFPEKIQVISQKNSGVSVARNNAIRQSKGSYILPLDADDLIGQKMVELSLKYMIDNRADIVYVNTQCFGIKNYLIRKLPFSKNNFLYENLCNVTSLYKKKMWEELGGYSENMKEGYEDWEFWIHAYKEEYKFQLLSEPLLLYRTQEISRNTKAAEKDTYLKAVITLNHPELYTIERVQKAIHLIKETELLADLYFYTRLNLSIDENNLRKTITHYLSSNTIREKQFINIPGTNKKIALFALDTIKNTEQLKQPNKEAEADFVLFYAPLRYEVLSLKNFDFAWDNEKGIIKANGSIFPFVFKSVREDNKLQLIAYQKELKYIKYKSKIDTQTAKKKYDSLRHKYNTDIKTSQAKLDKAINKYNNIMESISNLIRISTKAKPRQKISAYRSLKETYFKLKKFENEK